MNFEDFVRRAQRAQLTVDDLTNLDVAATAGGKATGATRRPKDSMDKIRLKGGPKQYKTGRPGPSGQERLQRRVNSLLVAAGRLARKEAGSGEGQWAARLATALRDFNGWQA